MWRELIGKNGKIYVYLVRFKNAHSVKGLQSWYANVLILSVFWKDLAFWVILKFNVFATRKFHHLKSILL